MEYGSEGRLITNTKSSEMAKTHQDDEPEQKLTKSAEVLQSQYEVVVESAEQLEGETVKQTDSVDRRTELAADAAAHACTGTGAVLSGALSQGD